MLLNAIGQYLQDQAIGTVGTDIFLGTLPDYPDQAMAIFEYGGSEPLRAMANNAGLMLLERPSFQVCVRSAGSNGTNPYATARNQIESVYRKLDGASGNLSGTTYYWIAAVEAPSFLMRDENGRILFTCNFDCEKALG